MTKSTRLLMTAMFAIVSSTAVFGVQAHPHYRMYWMGDDVSAIATRLGVPMPAVRLVPSALGAIEELTWDSDYAHRDSTSASSPVARLVFGFYENQLFRIVIDYAYHRTEGMTEADMVAAISRVYGQPARRIQPIPLTLTRGEDATIAKWVNGDSTIALLRFAHEASFRAIVSSTRLEGRVRAAGAYESPTEPRTAVAIDDGDQSAAAARTSADREKVRRLNIASFTP
jgi:hypothetical protein